MNRKIKRNLPQVLPIKFRNIIYNIILSSILITPLSLFATNYYVDADAPNGGDGSLNNPWNDLSDVENASLAAGDVVAFQRGDTWQDQLTISVGGTAGNPIIFTAYGSGPKPIITAKRHLVEEGNTGAWTDNGGNVWYTAKSVTPARIWLDGKEYLETLSLSGVNSSSRWHYDTGNKRLYVYATSNPGSAYTTIEASIENDDLAYITYAIRLNGGSDYTVFKNLDLRGGSPAFYIKGVSDHVTLDSCIVGIDAAAGIMSDVNSNYGEVKNCDIKSNYAQHNSSEIGPNDGIVMWNGGNYWSIHDNYFGNWGHNGISLDAVGNSNTNNNNEIYNNEFDGSSVDHMRAFTFFSDVDNICTGNKFYGNLVYDMPSPSKLSGNGNEVYYNVFYNHRNGTTNYKFEVIFVGQHNYICHDNKLYNNTFHSISDGSFSAPVGLLVNPPDISPLQNNEITNNIFYATTGQALFVHNYNDVKNNTFENNLFYSSNGSSAIIDYRGSTNTASVFNTMDANGDIISGNIQGDPLFKDIANGDFHLNSSTSPAVDAGLDLGLSLDIAGTQIPQNSIPDIGAYEFVAPSNGNIAGKVLDKRSGEPIPNAKITVTPGNYTDTTDASGNYSIANVPQGTYTVNASKDNYLDDTATVTVN